MLQWKTSDSLILCQMPSRDNSHSSSSSKDEAQMGHYLLLFQARPLLFEYAERMRRKTMWKSHRSGFETHTTSRVWMTCYDRKIGILYHDVVFAVRHIQVICQSQKHPSCCEHGCSEVSRDEDIVPLRHTCVSKEAAEITHQCLQLTRIRYQLHPPDFASALITIRPRT